MEELILEVVTESKVCPRCKREKPNSEFYPKKSTKDKLTCYCKICYLEYAKGSHKKFYSSEKGKLSHWEIGLRNKFGIGIKQYNEILDEQNGGCAICGVEKSVDTGKRTGRLSVDHDHDTGKVRGLLCQHCNSMLGHAKDNIDILLRAIQYLNKYKEVT